MSKFSKLNENQRNHGERISNHDERISNHDERISNHDERFRRVEKVLGIGDFMAITSPLPSMDEFQKKADGLVILTADDKQRLVDYQFSLGAMVQQPVVQKTIQSNPQNTPEKKNRRKDWCLRILNIKVECAVPDETLRDKTPRTGAKDKGKNWRAIAKAATLEITDTNEGQNLPYPVTIAKYLLRIHLALDLMGLEARLNNKLKREELYKSRADQLIAIWFEIDRANPRSLAGLKAKYPDFPKWDIQSAIRAA